MSYLKIVHNYLMEIPKSHPRRESLLVREMLLEGFKDGLVAMEGLIAHGRGEAFDYLIGERTTTPARKAIRAAAACLLHSKHPVISVNGNAAALAADDIAKLARESSAKVEVNLFYRTEERVKKISRKLREAGIKEVLGVNDATARIPELSSERRKVSPFGVYKADCVLVPLEDGDRTEALRKMGKIVIAVDLNPLSRTAKKASITIVDNLVRALPLLISEVKRLRRKRKEVLKNILKKYNNKKILKEARELINL
jgi:4-phosphopantoate--beta-alanine ligase